MVARDGMAHWNKAGVSRLVHGRQSIPNLLAESLKKRRFGRHRERKLARCFA